MYDEFANEPRRRFVKKSIIAGAVLAQPLLLAGLIRASAGEVASTAPKNTTVGTTEPGTTATTEPES